MFEMTVHDAFPAPKFMRETTTSCQGCDYTLIKGSVIIDQVFLVAAYLDSGPEALFKLYTVIMDLYNKLIATGAKMCCAEESFPHSLFLLMASNWSIKLEIPPSPLSPCSALQPCATLYHALHSPSDIIYHQTLINKQHHSLLKQKFSDWIEGRGPNSLLKS